MGFVNPAVMEGVRLAVRQAATDIVSSTISAITTADPAATGLQTLTLQPTSATGTPTTSTASSATGTETVVNGGNPSGGGGSQPGSSSNSNSSSPLLFFVALGFGVVFTNLWIIVGVKYCFRYNARSRQMRATGEDGEPINLENMPRPHRRRREKKLMTMDEVNEKFPMQKYKNWVSTRAHEGLPTRGGVSAPPSRAGSLRDADGVAPELLSKEVSSVNVQPTTSATAAAVSEKQTPQHATKESTSSTIGAKPRTSTDAQLAPTVSESATLAKDPKRTSHDDEEDEDEHINAALPPECMGTSGDTCAICIDGLEDDDDVRGLTCGHAFHAACVDPWLTSRRACCPLCKADYYTPKPRAPAAEAGEVSTPGGVIAVTLPGDNRNRMNLPNRPRTALIGFRRGLRPVAAAPSNVAGTPALVSPYTTSPGMSTNRPGLFDRFRRPDATPASPSVSTQTPAAQPETGGFMTTFRGAFPAFRAGRINQGRSQDPAASGAVQEITPSNLEAGNRNDRGA